MFGFLKLSGAPPGAYTYYQHCKNSEEKMIMDDLHKEFSALFKKHEKIVMDAARLEQKNRNESIREFRKRQEALVLIRAFDDTAKYGFEKRYSEFIISLFYPREISP